MSKRSYTVVEVQEFGEEQARQLLDGVVLPANAYNQENRLRVWLRNPLMLSLVLRIKETPEWARACKSRSSLYNAWAKYVAEEEAKKCNVDCDSLLTFYRATALKLLRARTRSISRGDLEAVKRQSAPGTVLEDAQLDAMEILIPSGENRSEGRRVRFFHETAYEYFVAAALRGDFEKALQQDTPEPALRLLQLGNVELDYLPSSVYGFLSEMLGSHVSDALLNRLEDRIVKSMPAKLARNLVESLGLLYRGRDDQKAAKRLLGLIRDARDRQDDADCTVGFNAARALERIHPRAPRPYFDYASDWREKDWTEDRQREKEQNICPNAMRGHYLETPKPGKRRIAVLPQMPGDAETTLQELVSKELADILDELINSSSQAAGESSMRINCSFAWVRWYHPSHELRLETLCKDAKARGLEKETIENLEEWVNMRR